MLDYDRLATSIVSKLVEGGHVTEELSIDALNVWMVIAKEIVNEVTSNIEISGVTSNPGDPIVVEIS